MIFNTVYSLMIAACFTVLNPAVLENAEIIKDLSGDRKVQPITDGKFVLDKKDSQLLWKGSNLFNFNEHSGKVDISKGEFTVEKGKLITGNVEIDMNTIVDNDNVKMLIDHLKSADFFDTEKHPTSSFKITKVEPITNPQPGKENFKILGDLSIKGITHTITFPAKVEITASDLTAEGKVIIDRTKWNVKYNSGRFFDNLGDETISDAIQFHLKIRAKK